VTAAATPPPPADPPVVADPEAYDDPRNAIARDKGLEAPTISGGEDPDPDAGLAEERKYGRLLVAMVLVIVGAGFVIGTILALAGLGGVGPPAM
jgi:hypothetical protein